MKRLIVALGILALLVVPITAYAAGATSTVTDTLVKDGGGGSHVSLLTFVWIANSGGAVTSDASDEEVSGYVFKVITDPGTTAPTALYNATLTDEDGVDVMGGELADRSATVSEQVVPKIDTVFGSNWVSGTLTLNIEGNSVNGGQGEVKVYIYTDEEARL